LRTKRIKSYLIEQNELKISILISGNNYRKLRSVFRLIAEIYKFSLQLQLTVLWLKWLQKKCAVSVPYKVLENN
jgi:hypothetical protein